MRGSYRPGHADYAYICKYGIADHRGGGRASARTTAPIVFCGAMAAQILAGSGIHVTAELVQAGHSVSGGEPEDEISACKSCGDSCGGTVKCEITGMPSGLGEPLFDKFQATLAQAIMGINAVKGFEYGQGFRSAYLRGSECLDSYSTSESGLHEVRNINGGTSGGITTGEKFLFSVAFKPTPTFPGNKYLYEKSGNVKERIRIGRHDPCVALRGKYIVRAMTEIITLDFLLQRKAYIPFQHESMV